MSFTNSINLERIAQLKHLDPQLLDEMAVVARVYPFRVSSYVTDELIDWSKAPEDPIFRTIFPAKEMLSERDFHDLRLAIASGDESAVSTLVTRLRQESNPHPGEQLLSNRPVYDKELVTGLQHKYRETVLFFPSEAQTCHSYCSYCFRWAQFVGDSDWRIAMRDRDLLLRYLRDHEEVTDVLVTGGDAFTPKATRLEHYLEPLTGPEYRHITNLRLGTKALSFWPYRFTKDADANELLTLVRRLADSGKHVAIMAHLSHWREMTTEAFETAVNRLQEAGAVIRTQSPILRGINDQPSVWRDLWNHQVRLGIVPYYMFIARDTGPKGYFSVPLAKAWSIYADAASALSGLGRTARGPVMSTTQGKVEILGVSQVGGEQAFVLRFLQSRCPQDAFKPFLAKFCPAATWFSELQPVSDLDVGMFEVRQPN